MQYTYWQLVWLTQLISELELAVVPLSLTACGCHTACAPSGMKTASLISSAHTSVQLLNQTPVRTHKSLMVHAFHANSTSHATLHAASISSRHIRHCLVALGPNSFSHGCIEASEPVLQSPIASLDHTESNEVQYEAMQHCVELAYTTQCMRISEAIFTESEVADKHAENVSCICDVFLASTRCTCAKHASGCLLGAVRCN